VNVSKEFALARLAQPFTLPRSKDQGGSEGHWVESSQDAVDGSRTLAGMLLAAVLAALLAVADQVIDTWSDGHMLMAWVALWTVAFAALALLAPPLRLAAGAMAGAVTRLTRAATMRRNEQQMWDIAATDYRAMADLQAARDRQGD
jgi:hypothetical protein